MAESSDGSTVRKMPAGKMKNIMQMFETGAAPDSASLGKEAQTQPPPKQAPRPSMPPPQPPTPASSKPQRPRQPPTPRDGGYEVAVRAANSGTEEAGEYAAPSVSERIHSLIVTSGNNKENAKIPGSPVRKSVGLPSKQGAVKGVHSIQQLPPPPISAKPPGLAGKGRGAAPEPRHRTKSEDRAGNRGNTQDSAQKTNVTESRPVSVVQRTKLFEGQPGPEAGNDGKELRVPKSVKRFHSVGNARDMTGRETAQEGPVWIKLPQHRDGSKEAGSDESQTAGAQAAGSTALGPPPKPPRTHAHDHYLETKVTSDKVEMVENLLYEPTGGLAPGVDPTAARGGEGSDLRPDANKIDLRHKGHLEAKPVPTHKRKLSEGQPVVSNGSEGDQPEGVYRPIHERISAFQNPNAKDTASKRGPPPARPTPPIRLQRPVSIATDSGSDLSSSPGDHHFLETTKRTRPPSSEEHPPQPPGRVHPYTEIADANWVERPISRFPLRKSLSSECLYSKSGAGGGLYEERRLPHRPPSTGSEDCPYIDDAGYAVPHKFVKQHVGAKASLDPSAMAGRPISHALKEKLGGIKRIFLPAPSSSPAFAQPQFCPVQEQDVNKVNKRKMSLVKQRINQAYAVVGRLIRRDEMDETDDAGVPLDTDSLESDSIVDHTEIQKRVRYACSVRALSQKHYRRNRVLLNQIYPQLFEYALIVGLQPTAGGSGYTPYIIHKFPETVDSNVNVPKFCFPDAAEFKPLPNAQSETYSFVLTNLDGGKVYGYCRRLQPKDTVLPEVLCIISPVDGFNMYNTLLEELEKRRVVSQDLCQELMAASFGRPLPKPGKVVNIRTLDEEGCMETIFLSRPADSRLENVNYECLLSYLGTDKLLRVVSSLLLERRVLLCSSQLSKLTQTVPAVVALLYPFSWQHIYIPILPADMLDVCSAPTPFIIGVLAAHLPYIQELPLEEVVIFDLDKKIFIHEVGDEATILPRKIQKAAKTAINMCKIDADTQSSQWLVISEAFMRIFVETAGHFGNHITTQQDKQKVFQKESFISSVHSKSTRQFLEWFTESQMFHVFITNQLERTEWGTTDLFMTRLREQKEEREQRSNARCLGQKVRDFGRAIKTKLQS